MYRPAFFVSRNFDIAQTKSMMYLRAAIRITTNILIFVPSKKRPKK